MYPILKVETYIIFYFKYMNFTHDELVLTRIEYLFCDLIFGVLRLRFERHLIFAGIIVESSILEVIHFRHNLLMVRYAQVERVFPV